MSWEIREGDVLERLREMPDSSVCAVLSDPPYGIGSREPSGEEIATYVRGESGLNTGGDFMGAKWSIPSVATWRELYRVLRPGAHLLVFAGSRTMDLMSIGLRAAGFEIRDTLAFMHASGFPKSARMDLMIDNANGDTRPQYGTESRKNSPSGLVAIGRESVDIERRLTSAASAASAAWVGHGTALKPAYEPIILARKPLDGTLAHNALTHGVGGLAIDACRIGYVSDEDQAAAAAAAAQRLCHTSHGAGVGDYGHHGENAPGSLQPYLDKQALGRWPANVLLEHDERCELIGVRHGTRGAFASRPNDPLKSNGFTRGSQAQVQVAEVAEVAEVYSCVDDCPVKLLDAQSGDRPGMSGGGQHRADYGGGMFGAIDSAGTARSDSGGASRFFFTSKPGASERNFGCDDLPLVSGADMVGRKDGAPGRENGRSGAGPNGGARNIHPTLKSISLTEYLAKLLLPPPRADGEPRRILVPFAGSGSEMIGCVRAGFEDVIGLEREPAFVAIARARLTRWSQVPATMTVKEALASASSSRADDRQTDLFQKVGS